MEGIIIDYEDVLHLTTDGIEYRGPDRMKRIDFKTCNAAWCRDRNIVMARVVTRDSLHGKIPPVMDKGTCERKPSIEAANITEFSWPCGQCFVKIAEIAQMHTPRR
jgi:hypothetical protein